MKKRILSIALALALVLSMSALAFAAGGTGTGTGGGTNPLSITSVQVSSDNLEGKVIVGTFEVVITFDRGMGDFFETNKSLITLTNDGEQIPITITFEDNSIYRFTVTDPESGAYVLTIGKDVAANNGNTVGGNNSGNDYVVNFTVEDSRHDYKYYFDNAFESLMSFLQHIIDFFAGLFNG